MGLPIKNNPVYSPNEPPKKPKIKTFYTMLSQGGYITEGNENNVGQKKKVVREWHV